MHFDLAVIFFIIAIIYSSVGFGGGSSYIAVLSLYGIAFKEMRLIALICNIIVVTGGTIAFIRHGQIPWKKVWPLVVASVPLAFIGAKLKLHENTFFVLLGLSLIVAAILLWFKGPALRNEQTNAPLKQAAIGGGIGFLSGMVGIGGGIFLSPVLNLSGWGTSKQIAGTASVFILVNSIAGIAGQLSEPVVIDYQMLTLLSIAVLVGGLIGSNVGIVKFNLMMIRRVTAVVVFIAAVEILNKHLLH
jgi:uncharacterized membrane protein YfcA